MQINASKCLTLLVYCSVSQKYQSYNSFESKHGLEDPCKRFGCCNVSSWYSSCSITYIEDKMPELVSWGYLENDWLSIAQRYELNSLQSIAMTVTQAKFSALNVILLRCAQSTYLKTRSSKLKSYLRYWLRSEVATRLYLSHLKNHYLSATVIYWFPFYRLTKKDLLRIDPLKCDALECFIIHPGK